MTETLFNADDSTCELCEATCFEPVARRDRRGRPLETVVCRHCGLIRHARIPSDDELQAFYSDQYRQQYHGEPTPSDRRVMRAWGSAERIYGRLRDRVAGDDRVLEIGAGIGCTVRRFADAGCEAWGLEPHRGFCDYGRRELNATLENLTLDHLPPTPRQRLVLLIHVIEHFNHPLRSLQRIHGLLEEDGLLYVECPNLSAPFARKSRMFHYAHVYTFSPITLTSLAARAGFQLTRVFASPRSPDLQMLFQRRDDVSWRLDGAGYAETMDALRRASPLRYALRREYWQRRKERWLGSLAEFWQAASVVARLRQQPSSDFDPQETPSIPSRIDSASRRAA